MRGNVMFKWVYDGVIIIDINRGFYELQKW